MKNLLEIMPVILLAVGQLMLVIIICRQQRELEELREIWEIIVERAKEAVNGKEG